MLVIKAYVNYEQIDEVWVHNTSGRLADGTLPNLCGYRIERPEGYERHELRHLRSLGWRALALKALGVLEREEPKGEKDGPEISRK